MAFLGEFMKIQFGPQCFKILATKRLILRKVYEQDAKDLYNNIYSNYEWHKYGYPGHVYNVRECSELLGKYEYRSKKGEQMLWGVVEKKTNEMVGIVLLYGYDTNENMCRMGCLMSYNHSGKGYAKEAVSKVMNFAYNEMNIRKLQIEIVRNNIPSLKLAKKIGMVYESTKKESYILETTKLDENVFFKLTTQTYQSHI